MTSDALARVGFTCAYTPLPLLDALGLVPYRVLPVGEAPDQAGQVLHDNLCPHVKRILDRALADDLPPLAAMVFMDSCDAMRRLRDAWPTARPAERALLVDLPLADDDRAVAYLARQLTELAGALAPVASRPLTAAALGASVERYDALARRLARLERLAATGALAGGWAALQRLRSRSVTEPVSAVLVAAAELAAAPADGTATVGLPVFLFGNVLPDPAAFELIAAAGARVVGDDLCTGARQLTALGPLAVGSVDEGLAHLARAVLRRPSCARSLGVANARQHAERIAAAAQAAGARGIIAHVVKFCDPYLARLPVMGAVLREAGLPLLVLEGDLTLRSLGQQRTRLEAFVEMIGAGP